MLAFDDPDALGEGERAETSNALRSLDENSLIS